MKWLDWWATESKLVNSHGCEIARVQKDGVGWKVYIDNHPWKELLADWRAAKAHVERYFAAAYPA